MPFVTGNPELDFFDQNPELVVIKEFRDLRDEEGVEKASKILWSIYMIEDPKSSIFNMPRKDKLEEVTDNYFDEYDEEKYRHISDVYARYCMEKEEWLYNIQIEKLDNLTSHLQKLELDKDKDFSKYIRIMDKLPKIWDALDKVKKSMIDKQSKTGLRGGARRSGREQRL